MDGDPGVFARNNLSQDQCEEYDMNGVYKMQSTDHCLRKLVSNCFKKFQQFLAGIDNTSLLKMEFPYLVDMQKPF